MASFSHALVGSDSDASDTEDAPAGLTYLPPTTAPDVSVLELGVSSPGTRAERAAPPSVLRFKKPVPRTERRARERTDQKAAARADKVDHTASWIEAVNTVANLMRADGHDAAHADRLVEVGTRAAMRIGNPIAFGDEIFGGGLGVFKDMARSVVKTALNESVKIPAAVFDTPNAAQVGDNVVVDSFVQGATEAASAAASSLASAVAGEALGAAGDLVNEAVATCSAGGALGQAGLDSLRGQCVALATEWVNAADAFAQVESALVEAGLEGARDHTIAATGRQVATTAAEVALELANECRPMGWDTVAERVIPYAMPAIAVAGVVGLAARRRGATAAEAAALTGSVATGTTMVLAYTNISLANVMEAGKSLFAASSWLSWGAEQLGPEPEVAATAQAMGEVMGSTETWWNLVESGLDNSSYFLDWILESATGVFWKVAMDPKGAAATVGVSLQNVTYEAGDALVALLPFIPPSLAYVIMGVLEAALVYVFLRFGYRVVLGIVTVPLRIYRAARAAFASWRTKEQAEVAADIGIPRTGIEGPVGTQDPVDPDDLAPVVDVARDGTVEPVTESPAPVRPRPPRRGVDAGPANDAREVREQTVEQAQLRELIEESRRQREASTELLQDLQKAMAAQARILALLKRTPAPATAPGRRERVRVR